MTSLDEKIVIGMSNMPRKQQNNHTPITESALVFLPESWYEERGKFEKDKWKKVEQSYVSIFGRENNSDEMAQRHATK